MKTTEAAGDCDDAPNIPFLKERDEESWAEYASISSRWSWMKLKLCFLSQRWWPPDSGVPRDFPTMKNSGHLWRL